jgi:hypothetical protein
MYTGKIQQVLEAVLISKKSQLICREIVICEEIAYKGIRINQ